MKPRDEQELSQAIRDANDPLCIQGGGTRGLAVSGEALETTALGGITLYEPGALTMVARSGTSLTEIEAALAAEGQMLPFEPYDLAGVTGAKGASTIGGVFATNASGARRVKAGAARDFLLGVRFVDGAGNIIKNGGRVMKNVTGYDLVKLMAGAHGTLGVMTEVSFKVLPKPETQATLAISGLADTEAVRAMAAALGSPFDVTGAAHTPAGATTEATTRIRIEGFADSVAYRAKRLRDVLGAFGAVTDSTDDWQGARNLAAYLPETSGKGGALWRLSVKPSDGPGLMARVTQAFECRYDYDWGGGRIWVWAGPAADHAVLHGVLQTEAAATGGNATLVNSAAPLGVSRFQPEPPPIARLTAGIRQRFDPRGILNPGLMA